MAAKARRTVGNQVLVQSARPERETLKAELKTENFFGIRLERLKVEF